jgi:hypothetical protein
MIVKSAKQLSLEAQLQSRFDAKAWLYIPFKNVKLVYWSIHSFNRPII